MGRDRCKAPKRHPTDHIGRRAACPFGPAEHAMALVADQPPRRLAGFRRARITKPGEFSRLIAAAALSGSASVRAPSPGAPHLGLCTGHSKEGGQAVDPGRARFRTAVGERGRPVRSRSGHSLTRWSEADGEWAPALYR